MNSGRTLVALLALSAAQAGARGEVIVFEETFGAPTAGTYCDPAFPPGWTLLDGDGGTPNAGVAQVNAAWVTLDEPFDAANCAAVSTSWYDPVGQSDDWMVTPLVHVPAGARLSWRAFSFLDVPDADDYEVRYSLAGTAPADFLAHPALFTRTDELTTWTGRSVDLEAAGLSGREVRFAFRNVSNDDYLLYVDDVRVSFDNDLFREEFGSAGGNGKCSPLFPATWARVNADGRTPESTVSFVDQAWVARNEDWSALTLAECVAISTSSYQPQGQADDWMITHAFQVPSAADLSWRAIADDAGFPDGYEVRYSTGGATPADFTAPPLFSVAAENAGWTARKVDLDAAGLGGQTIRLAFRNHSTDQFLLLVDSVEVSVPVVFRDGFDGGFAGAWSGTIGLTP